ncbi:MAG TPA: hypothetical protein DCL88_05395 [Gammaproteobacteria bacterium]|nr:hypothetical protein [Gammaproteobacteria bacterium]
MAGKSSANRGKRWPAPAFRLSDWFSDHRRAIAETFEFVSLRLGSSLFVWLLVGIALALPAALRLAQQNFVALDDGWQGQPGLTVYFTVGTEPDNVAGVQAQLRQSSSVAAIQLTDAEQALQEFMAASADSSSLTAALVRLPENPLPATLQVSVVSDASLEELGALREQLVGLDGVDEVVIERTWLELLRNLTQLVERLGLILGVLFALGAVLVTAASVRLAIESRLEELRVLSLVGATRAQIRRPFLYFGVFYGLGGAVVAAMLLAITLTAIEAPLTALLGSYDIPVHVHGFGVVFLLTLLGVGMGLGVIGALVAVRQRIRGVQEMAY